MATALTKAGCSRFYVAWPQEGANLRRVLGPVPEISVFHGPTNDTMDLFAMYQLVPVLNHLEQIDLWLGGNIESRPAAIHVDTGMNRLGLSEAHWAAAARMFPKPVKLVSHLAGGDEDAPCASDGQGSRAVGRCVALDARGDALSLETAGDDAGDGLGVALPDLDPASRLPLEPDETSHRLRPKP